MTRKIIIADDHFVVRLGTTLILESHYKDVKVSCAESYINIKKSEEKISPDLLYFNFRPTYFKTTYFYFF
ncbi:DNA-binding NarL/FixJ family response regulator [Chryseobacterium vietnamense]|uniref:DNA-binding NarL/FixJ family response regulator n=1 Tax=Chryseobacterium vietnamense TaxID=866785 RepID=A0ACC6J6S3_9FLAO|nr:hypothetical protein [Chryseobacterium vietnamense]MDR6458562.1 DNA-binding NarL/FixJ family response regulator [Chryseobacterium vietnamense]